MEKKSRKRHATDSSIEDTSFANSSPIKKRKKSKRGKSDIVEQPPPLPLAQSSPPKRKQASAPVQAPSITTTNGKKVAKKKQKTAAEKVPNEDVEPTEVQAKPKKKGKAFYLKPVNGSWSKHVGSLMMYRAVSQAVMMEVDPREIEGAVNWSMMSGGFVSAKDLELIWCLIKREFPDKSLAAIRDDLKPYTTITPGDITRAGVREQFKSEFPKAPPTAYMLFVRSKMPAMRAKFPDISMVEIAKKLGAKWQSMGSEKQEKFKQQYQTLKIEFDTKLADFYDHHPEAKVPSRLRGKLVKDGDSLTPEEKRIKELKTLLPKSPVSAYMLFCKAKRHKVQKQHPELSTKEITLKLSKKWKEMKSQQAKYKQSYEDQRSHYKALLRVFHETYPDAKQLLANSGKKTKSEEISTQTSMVATPGSAPFVATDETDYSTDYSTSEDDDKGGVTKRGVAKRGVAVPTKNDTSDNETSSVLSPPRATSAVSTQSRDQSPDTIDTSSDDSD